MYAAPRRRAYIHTFSIGLNPKEMVVHHFFVIDYGASVSPLLGGSSETLLLRVEIIWERLLRQAEGFHPQQPN